MADEESSDRSEDGPDDPPADRCGFTVRPEHTVRLEQAQFGGRNWNIEQSVSCCWRPTWRDYDRCIWHAEVEEKPASELVASRADGPECLDGAYLHGVDLDNRISFANCSLVGIRFISTRFQYVDFSNTTLWSADLRDSIFFEADLSNTCIRGSDLSDTDISRADFENSNLRNATLTDSTLERTNFENAELSRCDFTDAHAWRADFTNASLYKATFTEADLKEANLTQTNFVDATLTGCDLEGATLVEADLGGADFVATRLYRAQLRDVYVNEATGFGRSGYEAEVFEKSSLVDKNILPGENRLTQTREWLRSRLQGVYRWWYWVRLDDKTRREYAGLFEKAASDYRMVRRLHQENDMPDGIVPFTIRARHADRWQAFIDKTYFRWYSLETARWVMLYGESPLRVIYTSIWVVILFGLLYSFTGGVQPLQSGTNPYAFDLLPSVPLLLFDEAKIVWANIRFSAVVFTTLGSTSVEPASGQVETLVAIQSFISTFLTALFAAVLGRRFSR